MRRLVMSFLILAVTSTAAADATINKIYVQGPDAADLFQSMSAGWFGIGPVTYSAYSTFGRAKETKVFRSKSGLLQTICVKLTGAYVAQADTENIKCEEQQSLNRQPLPKFDGSASFASISPN